ncbi:hypothetical protein MNL13_06555 [Bartonella krasnovii]|uniref:Uncharacterized protein n=1 Tax=Bartonella krasnovii TaxID=2267275 RepID=A0ABY3VU21_9HYPH|nr:hypothetical protein [Bartonella krasnovii]UNF28861.1 hypothetical protein MNL13_06555 [Bartonella krasnovii]
MTFPVDLPKGILQGDIPRGMLGGGGGDVCSLLWEGAVGRGLWAGGCGQGAVGRGLVRKGLVRKGHGVRV